MPTFNFFGFIDLSYWKLLVNFTPMIYGLFVGISLMLTLLICAKPRNQVANEQRSVSKTGKSTPVPKNGKSASAKSAAKNGKSTTPSATPKNKVDSKINVNTEKSGDAKTKTEKEDETQVQASKRKPVSQSDTAVESDIPEELRTPAVLLTAKSLNGSKESLPGSEDRLMEITADSDSFDNFVIPEQFRIPETHTPYKLPKRLLPSVFDANNELKPPAPGPGTRITFRLSFPLLFGIWWMTEPELRAYLFTRSSGELRDFALESTRATESAEKQLATERSEKAIARIKAVIKHCILMHNIVLDIEAWRNIKDLKYKNTLCPWAFPNMIMLTWIPGSYLRSLFLAEPLNGEQLRMIFASIQRFRIFRHDVDLMKVDEITQKALKISLKDRIDKLQVLCDWTFETLKDKTTVVPKEDKTNKLANEKVDAAAAPASKQVPGSTKKDKDGKFANDDKVVKEKSANTVSAPKQTDGCKKEENPKSVNRRAGTPAKEKPAKTASVPKQTSGSTEEEQPVPRAKEKSTNAAAKK